MKSMMKSFRLQLLLIAGALSACEAPPPADATFVAASVADADANPISCAEVIVESRGIADLGTFMAERESIVEQAFGLPLSSQDNESHDCQRIFDNSANSSGPCPSGNCPLVTLWRFRAANTMNFDSAVTVAGIATQGGTYRRLGLTSLKSCLVLQRTADTLSWLAWVVPAHRVNHNDSTCTYAERPGNRSKGKALDVRMLPASAHPDVPDKETNPHSIRLIDDGNRFFIALRCRSAWCVIGDGFNVSNYKSPNHAWGDQQRLFRKVENGIVPTRILANLRPHPGLRERDTTMYKDTMLPAATIVLQTRGTLDERNALIAKWRLGLTELPDSITVYLGYMKQAGTYEWRIRYGELGIPNKAYHFKSTHGAMGTTRWRWSENDEGVWIQCPDGCCGDGFVEGR